MQKIWDKRKTTSLYNISKWKIFIKLLLWVSPSQLHHKKAFIRFMGHAASKRFWVVSFFPIKAIKKLRQKMFFKFCFSFWHQFLLFVRQERYCRSNRNAKILAVDSGCRLRRTLSFSEKLYLLLWSMTS